MSNKKQSSVDKLWDDVKGWIPQGQYAGVREYYLEAKAMHKEEILKAINEVSENNVKYANMIIASWSQIEGELFLHNTKLAEQYYKETFKSE